MRSMNNRKKWRKLLVPVFALALGFMLTACGGESASTNQVMPEYTYVPQYIELDSENGYYGVKIRGNELYNQVYEFDETAMTATQKIVKQSIAEGTLSEEVVLLEFDEYKSIQNFTVDADENIYTLEMQYPEVSEEEMMTEAYYESRQSFLRKYDAQGELVYEQDISELLQEDDMYGYLDNMCADALGRLYATSNDKIRLFDENGNYVGDVQTDSWINSMGQGKDGKMYASYYDNVSTDGSYILAEIDFVGKKLGASYKNFYGGNTNTLIPGIEKDFLVQDGTKVYEYEMASQTSTELFNWVDCDINGSYVNNMSVTDDGKIIVLMDDWNTGKSEMAFLTKTKSDTLPEKQILTLGSLYDNQDVQAAVVAFNKSNDKYRIKIKTYMDMNNYSEDAYKDAVTRLNNDIISGTNCPDILDMSQISVTQMAAKGVFEDLTPYLEASSVLNKEDYFENVLEGFTYENALVTIPKTFSLQTVMGRTADVGEKEGWTLSDMIALSEKHPEAALFDYADKLTMMMYCFSYNEDAFIDWESGECKFESEEFKQLLEFVNKFPDEFDWESDDRSTPEKIADGDVLLNTTYISSYDELQYNIAYFNGDPVTCIGFPNLNGESGCMMTVSECYGMSSKSANKEAAWEFIEGILSEETGDRHYWGFPSRKSELEKMREEVTKVEYLLDENGEMVLDENGEPIEVGGSSGGSISIGSGGGGWSYTYHQTTEEEADLVDKLIDIAMPANYNGNQEVLTIIQEEAEAYYQGQKSVDDVAKVIQSRIQLYVNENQ